MLLVGLGVLRFFFSANDSFDSSLDAVHQGFFRFGFLGLRHGRGAVGWVFAQALLSARVGACATTEAFACQRRDFRHCRGMNAVFIFLVIGMSVMTSTLVAEIKEQAVEYKAGDVVCEGWSVVDTTNPGKRPAILIVHQWTGLTDYEKMRARMLAELGYAVFAADIYGKGIRPVPPAAGQEAGKYKGDRALYRARLNAALDVMRKDEHTDTARMAAIGYCFGGTGVLELARSGADVKAVVSFHGGLDSPTPKDGSKIKCKVLVLHGADDPFVPAQDLAAFEAEMKSAGVSYQLVKYPGAVHAFTHKMAGTDNSKGVAYHAEADVKSWLAMKEFLAASLK